MPIRSMTDTNANTLSVNDRRLPIRSLALPIKQAPPGDLGTAPIGTRVALAGDPAALPGAAECPVNSSSHLHGSELLGHRK